MPRKAIVRQELVDTPEKPRTEGRAVIPAPEGSLVLPGGFRIHHTAFDPYTEQHEYIIAGPGLPPWKRGVQPARFASVADLGAYLQGDRSKVTIEPA